MLIICSISDRERSPTGRMKAFIVDFEVQGVLPAQMQPYIVEGSSVRGLFHELQEGHPGHGHRLDGCTSIV